MKTISLTVLWLTLLFSCDSKPQRLTAGSAAEAAASCTSNDAGCDQSLPGSDAVSGDKTVDQVVVSGDKTVDQIVVNDDRTFNPSIDSIVVKNSSQLPAVKGDDIVIEISLKNSVAASGKIALTPLLTLDEFSDYTNVRLPTAVAVFNKESTKTVGITVSAMFQHAKEQKYYALAAGKYKIKLESERPLSPNISMTTIENAAGSSFEIGSSNVVYTATLWEKAFLEALNYSKGMDQFLKEAFTNYSEILVPTERNGNTGTYKKYSGGFDEMMGIKTVFKNFEGYRLANGDDNLGQAARFGKDALGLVGDFQQSNCDYLTAKDNHGFDMLILLSKEGYGGGVAGLCGNILSSCVFYDDNSELRSKLVLIHETGHNYGADHCDDDGLSGYVMCSGEAHDHYKSSGAFVWHQNSIDSMANVKGLRSDDSFKLNLNSLPGNELSVISCKGF